ncbi:MAG: hypothetical protein RSE94_16500 [Pseudomonas sp.]
MPTDNRSSNTEQMVSLPLDLVELTLAHLPSDSAAGFELRELLSQPTAQPQYPPCDYCGATLDNHPWHGSGILNGVESRHIRACDGCRDKLPPAQLQGEPVLQWSDEDGWWLDCTPSELESARAEGFKTRTLYRHPPTSDGFSAGDMADQGAKAFAARNPEVEELRTLLSAMTSNYACALEAGYDRITALGGDCDSVEKMLSDNPDYAKAVAALSTSAAQNPSE